MSERHERGGIMTLELAPDLPEGFVGQARQFLDDHAPRRLDVWQRPWGVGPDTLGGSRALSDAEEREWLTASREWRRVEFDGGYGWLTGPSRFGGRELPLAAERAYRNLREDYEIPRPDLFMISLGMVAPTILRHGSDDIRDQYLRPLYRGDLLGCQLFSEPGAGSDLASLTTRAVLEGDTWLVNGQKVWTSFARQADIGLLLCRTEPDQPKHLGITAFVLDMTARGVDVRPLRQMTGGQEFNEVFFTDVRIPDSHRLGAPGQGWAVAIGTLMGERALGVAADVFGLQDATGRLIRQVRELGHPLDSGLRDQVAARWVQARIVQLMAQRADAKLRRGVPPGPEESVVKLGSTEAMRRLADTAAELLGPALVADTGEWSTTAWAGWTMHTAGCRIGAGSDEVMRNILAERVLGLPK